MSLRSIWPWLLAFFFGAFVLAVLALSSGRFVESRRDDSGIPAHIREAILAARYPEAVAVARSWSVTVSDRDGKDSPRAREATRLLVEALWRNTQSMDPRVLSLAEGALAADEHALPPDDTSTAMSL